MGRRTPSRSKASTARRASTGRNGATSSGGPLVALVIAVLAGVVACNPHGSEAGASYPATDVSSISVDSHLLGRAMPVLLFRPRGLDPAKPFAILYVFHGYGADETAWFDGHGGDGIHADGKAQALMDERVICPVVIASAFIANSYGVDSEPASDQFDHGPYAGYLAEELLPAVESAVGYHGGATDRFVGGLSMGGFAALHLALTRPSWFAGIGALSPAAFVTTPRDRQWLFDGNPEANDPMRLIRTAPVGAAKIFLGYGTSDYGWVRDGARELAARLVTRHLPATTREVPGGHDAGTWRQLVGPMMEALLAAPCPG